MPRKPTGSVVEPKDGRGWAIRFRAYGKRRSVTLGKPEEGWDRQRAEDELAYVFAQVERGEWRPPEPAPAPIEEPKEIPTFHSFASEWLANREPELAPKTVKDYRWALVHHLLPVFRDHRLDAIDVRAVDAYRTRKVKEGRLAANQINKTLKILAAILDAAIEYEIIDRANPARGRRRRVKAPKPRRTWVEPEQLIALLEAAPKGHRPILATLAGAGLRVGEACALDWRDVNLATGTIHVGKAKTDAGTYREVDLPLGLAEELREHKAASTATGRNDPVFTSRPRNGKRTRQHPENVARRLKTAIKRANETLDDLGIEPISERVSPHSLRRTYASLRAACGDDPVYIAQQLGHEDPTFTIRVYAKAAKRRERLSGEYLAAFDRAREWAANGQRASESDSERPTQIQAEPGNPLTEPRIDTRPRSSAG